MSESMTQSFRYWRVRRDEAAVDAWKAKLKALQAQKERLQDEISTVIDRIDKIQLRGNSDE